MRMPAPRLWCVRAALSLTLGLLLSGISQAEERFIILQSTTSTQNSGLFDAILPRFQSRTGIEVRVGRGRDGPGAQERSQR